MFFEVLDDLYLFLIKNKNMSFFKIFILSLKICCNLIILMTLFSLPFIVLYYLTC